jgi:hypothetical protein
VSDDQKDIDTLTEALQQLLAGELKVGVNLLPLGGALKRKGASKEWVVAGLNRWLEEHEDAVPIVAAALSDKARTKLQEILSRQASA